MQVPGSDNFGSFFLGVCPRDPHLLLLDLVLLLGQDGIGGLCRRAEDQGTAFGLSGDPVYNNVGVFYLPKLGEVDFEFFARGVFFEPSNEEDSVGPLLTCF